MKKIIIDPSVERRILDLRLLRFNDILVLGRYAYGRAHAPLGVHDHGNMLEICYLAEGKQFYRVGEEEFFLKGGDILINYPHERHGTGLQREGRGTLYWMIINPPSPKGGFLGFSRNDGQYLWNEIMNLPSRHFRAPHDSRKKLDQLFSLIDSKISERKNSRVNDSFFLMNIRNYFQRFLLDTITASRLDSRVPVSAEIRMVTELIKSEITVFHTMKILARTACLSESRFKHRFREEIGTSPADYQMRCKIDLASRMLLDESESIINTASYLGFSSSQYFSTVFRRYMGLSPHQYRLAASQSDGDAT